MGYQVTARKWRPQSFEQVMGQDSLVRALKNSLANGKIPHAYLFSGVRGVGKTTTARIIAKALNCKNLNDNEPCNECSSCVEITSGYSMDVIEIDGASNRGIDNIREIRDTVTYLPLSGRYKIYIIDEVHMLTNEASNALLKTLEEPPAHAVFILATTESHKVLPTIRSRCQHYVFRKIPVRTILNQLKMICKADNIEYTDEALYLIALAAEGSMRDAESLFDQVALYTEGNITDKAASELLGIPDIEYFGRIADSLSGQDAVAMLSAVNEYLENTGDIKLFVKNWIGYLKNGMLVKKVAFDSPILDVSEQKYAEIKSRFEVFKPEEILRILNLFVDCYKDLKGDANERFLLETALFKALDYKNMIPLSELRNELMQLAKSGSLPATAQTAIRQNPVSVQPQQRPAVIRQEMPEAPVEPYKITPKQAVVESETIDNYQEEESNEVITEDLAMRTFQQVLAKSMIMKPMLKSIVKIQLENNLLKIEMGTGHSCEYLSQNKADIVKEMTVLLHKKIDIRFAHKNEKETEVCLPDVEIKRPAVKQPAPDTTPPVPESINQDAAGKTMAETVRDLFDGK